MGETKKRKNSVKKSKEIKIKKKSLAVAASIILIVILLIALSGYVNLGGSQNSDKIVASVNGEKIMQSQVNQLQESAMQQGQQLDNKSALEQTINQRLILQEAEKEGYSVTTEEAENDLKQRAEQQGTTLDKIKGQIEAQGNSYDDFLKNYAEQISVQDYIAGTINISEVSDEEARQFYDDNKDKLSSTGEAPTFEDIKDQIVAYLKSQEQNQKIIELIDKLRANANISYE